MARHIERSALVPYSAGQMYALVNDIENYPKFMSGCVNAEILASGEDFLEARLDLKKAGIEKSFVTRNTLVPDERIELHLVDGPFKTLEGVWEFRALNEQASKVSLSLTFEFENRLVALAADPWFEGVGNQLVSALVDRAKKVYG
ncbi:type II toxin-antitoxin system RatA family toxin [Proteobacteria bacterium 005FR1]|nr:type II toxin-antitoxin system RatA family toxin [Proteobacteria bacterium 005FR1]